MKRRKAREYVLQYLFQSEFRGKDQKKNSSKQFLSDKEKDPDVRRFATDIIEGTLSMIDKIDDVIRNAAEHWNIDRMAAVDRNILRFSVYELLYRNDIPSAVTINEAIEIAKKYSTSESAAFINGILDRIAKNINKK